ncbi:transthyretin-like family protein [Zavarzinella formosa]|uniref:hypothetical protein n=1 Tax=Zavarzinella formosa TaxID=360055 RepID=UPI0012F98DA7|nr:hypothetical protein [Zavarzinella formosa]
MKIRPEGWMLLLGVVLFPTGCSDTKKEKPVFKVHGKLTFEGKPMAKVEIAFVAVAQDQREVQPRATADENGMYVLSAYRDQDGAPAGEYLVTIYWPGPRKPSVKTDTKTGGAAPDSPEAEDEAMAPDRLKNVYRFAHTTKLKAAVAEKDNEIDFKLP